MKRSKARLLSVLSIQVVAIVIATNLAALLGSLLLRATTRGQSRDLSATGSARSHEMNAYEQKAQSYLSYKAFKQDNERLPDYQFRSFSGWRSAEFSSPSINISREGVRSTPVVSPLRSGSAVWMLGGSTIWGYGVSDRETIPAYFQSYSGLQTLNLGEQAYTSRQSLNLLLNQLVRSRLNHSRPLPRLVIAYEGVNDTLYPCGPQAGQPFVHDRESQIQQALVAAKHSIGLRRALQASLLSVAGSAYKLLFPAVSGFQQELLRTKAERPRRSSAGDSAERCLSDAYARTVALNLVQNWESTYQLLRANGIRFYAFLQPTPYQDPAYRGPVVSGFNLVYSRIYPLVRAYAKGKPWFVDGSAWFSGYGKPAWLDPCCHVNPMANGYIARTIITELRGRGALSR